jgi:23S rRNA pseudouridine955/2504/2580 synthase
MAPSDLTPGALEAWVCGEAGLSAPAWASMCHHQGLWINRQRWVGQAVAAGSEVVAYAFLSEPEAIEITEKSVLAAGELVAIDKPAWICTQGTRASDRLSVEAQVRRLLGRPELVAAHRLDRETSGVLLFSAPGPAAAALHAQFRAHAVEKIYHARVERPLEAPVTVEGPLVRVLHAHHSLFALQPGAVGLESRTHFAPLGAHQIEARPETGRTHQIRAHLAWLGHPIAGDTLYNRPWSPGDAQRTLLHAARIRLRFGGVQVEFEAPQPIDFVDELADVDAGSPPTDQAAAPR